MKPVCAIPKAAACGSTCISVGKRHAATEQAFTLVELLVVISIIGLLAGLFLGIGGAAMLKGKEGRIRAELQHHNTVIESYVAKIGSPPPSSEIRGAPLNPLYYELSGTLFTNQSNAGRFCLIGQNPANGLTAAQVTSTFGVEGFANSARDRRNVKLRTEFRPSAVKTVVTNGVAIEVLVAPVPPPANPLPNGPAILTTTTGKAYPWYYDSASTNRVNSDSFDLWTEVQIGKKFVRFSNWEPGPVVIGP